ncbi:hypothetical protein OSB04_028514 [Centaurea solstitialis]|uniref:Uncharacterized protein n=1 Tax=Centaurea solstitialis TaxID=347529 RepID=A0AA38SGM5_9ASTR|nr:hypothetical protein OSB04_028514 [Centaurea solstitialis]
MDGDGEWMKVASKCEFYKPLHLMKNGTWLMDLRSHEGYVYEVDLVRKTTKNFGTYSSHGPMDILCGGKFVETIVSLSSDPIGDGLTKIPLFVGNRRLRNMHSGIKLPDSQSRIQS